MRHVLLQKSKYLLALALVFTTIGGVLAQGFAVTGKVVDEKGEGLPGVTVVLKGTTTAAPTDGSGVYRLTLPDGSGTLVFSYIGYQPKDVPINGRATVNVTLAPDAKALEEVVIIGYTAVPRSELTSSVSSVGAKQLRDVPVSTAAEALAGRLAGVQVTTSEGQPGAEIQIRVRGGGSITQDNSPLYIVDGIQMENALSVLSPQEIQSIDVLKDAASTAIYGARGANGVVVITTKGGKAAHASNL
ncbi:TonB-dependent receptor plug domain-containing protein [Pontibacter sp. CAU 1760]